MSGIFSFPLLDVLSPPVPCFRVLPMPHLIMASSQRVMALILEEIAIDMDPSETRTKLLKQ